MKKKKIIVDKPRKSLENDAVEEKPTKKQKTKTNKKVEYPIQTFINKWGFLLFRKAWLEDLGWHKGMPIEINKNPDGSVTIRRVNYDQKVDDQNA